MGADLCLCDGELNEKNFEVNGDGGDIGKSKSGRKKMIENFTEVKFNRKSKVYCDVSD